MSELGFSWRKHGLIFEGHGRHPKLATHAANPLAVHLHKDTYRVYFCGRDANNRSSVGAFDFDVEQCEVTRIYDEPFLVHGEVGSFCENGISIGNCYTVGNRRFILFMAWQQPEGRHWRGDVGRIELFKDGSMSLAPNGVYMKPDGVVDLSSLSYPWVLQVADDDYRMWYGSTYTWDAGNEEMIHPLHVARSTDGENWNRQGIAIPFAMGVAQAFSRPTAIEISGKGYHMWYSFRRGGGDKYKIGYASSDNLVDWTVRNSESGISCSLDGWDSEMIEYPCVFSHKDKIYMLYNGNGHGASGIGLADLCIG